jgi:hypothetical protein
MGKNDNFRAQLRQNKINGADTSYMQCTLPYITKFQSSLGSDWQFTFSAAENTVYLKNGVWHFGSHFGGLENFSHKNEVHHAILR